MSTAFVPLADAAGHAPADRGVEPDEHADGLAAELWGNPNPFKGDSFPSQYPILVTLGWVVVITAFFGFLGVRALPEHEPLTEGLDRG